ncbi:Maf family protein [Bosea sp. (in: a-proteobacteria)]|uniref:Maf family protein n=1 Tax=Bosea sp. (in: a-proteobacteria) TaxID=1871050 RepID=UPI001224977C|nr:Maf family protein [Bosea sp. (in: a-proteobacteria)]TAJ34394.1 MAG: septum formation inhibitor Maf [Bosea sp. (in: a-proteobacteria)]
MSDRTLWLQREPLVLASGSVTRRDMLAAIGIPVDVVKPGVDERAIEASLEEQDVSAKQVAKTLANAKARAVSVLYPARFVLAADQTLDCEGRRFHKPTDPAQAADQLMQLAGRSHWLHAAFALAHQGEVVAEGVGSSSLAMRAFDRGFVTRYLAVASPGVLASVGSYQIEGLGAHLFERIEGDHFTILGLPLLPVLAALRAQGCLAA